LIKLDNCLILLIFWEFLNKMKKLTRSNKIILLFIFFLFLSINPSKRLEAEGLKRVDIEVIIAIIVTQEETIEALIEFNKLNAIDNKSKTLINNILKTHELNINELNKFKIEKEEEQGLINYEVPVEDLKSKKKFIDYLIDLSETNIYSYMEAVEDIESSKLKIIINRVIERDKITLKNLIMMSEDTY